MRWIALLLIALLPSTGQAASIQDKDGTWWTMVSPPARYLAYRGELRTHFLPRAEIFETCQYLTGLAGAFGCANRWPIACDVYVVEDLPKQSRAEVYMHELAHCGGWPADHPLD